MESYSRIRSVKLRRENPEEPFGFSVRGGHEHGTGIFVSHVEPRSMAHKARLKVGDQILRLNGFPVSAAVHNECLALMRFRTSLHLKVRSVGMIPVREKMGDPLTWKLVEEPPLLPMEEQISGKSHPRNQGRPAHFGHSRHSGSDSSSHFDSRLLESHGNESKVFIDINGHSGLGCCESRDTHQSPSHGWSHYAPHQSEQHHHHHAQTPAGWGWNVDTHHKHDYRSYLDIALTTLALLSFGISLLNLLLNALLFSGLTTGTGTGGTVTYTYTTGGNTNPGGTTTTGGTQTYTTFPTSTGITTITGTGIGRTIARDEDVKRGHKKRRERRELFEPYLDPMSSVDLIALNVLKSIDAIVEKHECVGKVFCDTNHQAQIIRNGFQFLMPLCCICKGPPERPGIFVQSTKSNGVAREAGLRPGDQIIQCNGHSFLNIPFAEAVYHLKVSKHLNLVVIKGAASDLFPGESSGYNSSASSLNGDTHISASSISSSSNNHQELNGEDDHHYRHGRLPLVSEERRPSSKGSSNSEGDGIVLDRHIEWNEVEESWKEAEKERLVIQIRGEEETIKSSMISSVRITENAEEKRLLEERKKLLEDQRRLLEEAVKFEEEKRQFEAEKRRLELMKTGMTPAEIAAEKSESDSSTPRVPQNTLAGALHKEILKRVERRENGGGQEKAEDEKPKPGTVDQKISLFANTADAEKRQQHEQLIKEFKRAHRKMFAHSLEQIETTGEENSPERHSYVAKRIQKEVEHERKMVQQQVQGIVRQRQLRIERQHQECQETEREVGQCKSVFKSAKSPPPPPPVNGVEVKTTTTGSAKWTTLSIKLPSGTGSRVSPVPTGAKTSKPDINHNKLSNGVQSQIQAPIVKKVPTVVNIQKQDVDIPESPSPDYSNSPSPTPQAENQWDDRVSANGKIFNRNGPTKFGFPPTHQHQKESKYLPRNNMCTNQNNNVVKTKDSEITTSGNGKVTIIVGDPNHLYNGSLNTQSSQSSKGVKSSGGILKMANGNCNVNDHSVGSLPQKTISFGEF